MSTENYDNPESRAKLKSLAESIKIGMMLTNLKKQPIHSIPMRTKKVDEDGNLWFLSPMSSEHNENISRDNNVQLLYSHPGDMKFLSVFGKAEIMKDRDILEDLYDKTSDNWFDGLDDPEVTAIKFTPKEAYYWDTKDNKYIALLKMGIGAITGNEREIGKKGELDL